jgi:hypothetical protein
MVDGKGGIALTGLVDDVPTGSSIAYRVRHFSPDMAGWQDRLGKPALFPLVAVEPDRWYFDGMTIERTGADALAMRVRISGKDGPREIPLRLVRRR